jgi:uncharacterized protein YcnI
MTGFFTGFFDTTHRTKGPRMKTLLFTVCVGAATIAQPAFAHVTLEQAQASPGSFYKMVLRVPHGCDGSATVRLKVTLPEGIIGVKPMVKPGWSIAMTRAAYGNPHDYMHGAKFTEGVKTVTWSGGTLPDAFYDEFVLSTYVSGDLKPGETIYFPVVQTCEKGEHRWIGIPKPGAEPSSEPAPALKIAHEH